MTTETTLLDIYRAAGVNVTEDGGHVSIPPTLKPFEIILKVVPTGVSFDYDEPAYVEFDVLLSPDVIEDGYGARHIDHDAQIKLPAHQVRIRQTPPMPESETRYDGWPLKRMIEEFVLIRGDLTEPYAREQLAAMVLRSKEVRELLENA